MMKLTDITPEYIFDLFKKHQFLPKDGQLAVLDRKCCGLGVVAYEKGIELDSLSLSDTFASVFEDSRDSMGFALGFDRGYRLAKGLPTAVLAGAAPATIRGYEVGVYMAQHEHEL